VLTLFHVEQPRDDLVIPAGFLQTFADQIPHVPAGDLALQIEGIHRRPERLAIFDQLLVEVVGDGTPAFSPWSRTFRSRSPDVRRKFVRTDHFTAAGDSQPLDDVL